MNAAHCIAPIHNNRYEIILNLLLFFWGVYLTLVWKYYSCFIFIDSHFSLSRCVIFKTNRNTIGDLFRDWFMCKVDFVLLPFLSEPFSLVSLLYEVYFKWWLKIFFKITRCLSSLECFSWYIFASLFLGTVPSKEIISLSSVVILGSFFFVVFLVGKCIQYVISK